MIEETRDIPRHQELHALLFSTTEVRGFFFTSPANNVTLKMQETGLRFVVLIPEELNV